MVPISLICHTHIFSRGQHVNWSPFSRWNVRINQRWCVRLDAIRASAHPLVAFSGFYESHECPPSSNVRGIVPPHCDGLQNGQQSGYMLHHPCVDCRPGSLWGNTERGVARWQRPVVLGEALVMLYREMCSVSHRRTAMAIKMACDRGAFVRHCSQL